ncbi:adenylate/guanylate cyclase domain-containing protein [Rhodococcoides yunnanense]|uniref:adenylate/guanylate cyclase domain-containing protein n=1 Tax=Rhodococcoides yunnanense TaxID=278209 RepID=UPI001476697E|nr:adenylate/guanylate cyclase domain-containing protein [Rhodococcus yunnanensis]
MSVVSVIVVGAVGYVAGTSSLRSAAFDRLTELRESRAREITARFNSISNSAAVITHSATTIDATNQFSAAFGELAEQTSTPAQTAGLDAYYADVFAPALEENTGKPVDPSLFVPRGPAERYLQSMYTVPANGDFEAAISVDTAGDSSAWSAVNAKFQPFFEDLTTRFGFEDSLILDPAGTVVYSAYKGADLGTNVRTGPYRASNLASGFEQAMQASSIDDTLVTDFQRYAPSYDKPTSWVMTPIGTDGVIAGVLALQLPIEAINSVMTADNGWVEDGLGETGETYLAGPDRLMRSVSRMLTTDPDAFIDTVVSSGTSPSVAALEVARGGSILLQPVDTVAVNAALAGETGVEVADDYTGEDTLVAYTPLDIPGIDWVLVAKIDSDEALAPVDRFARNLALSTAAIVLLVSLLSLLLARVFTRPLKQLAGAVREISAGNLGVDIPVTTDDELGELGRAFNDMSHSLATKQQLLQEQQKENEELLHNLMPAPVAKRYRDGESNISAEHKDVSVIFAELVGFGDYAAGISSEKSSAAFNALIHSFEEAAERHGVERVRNLRNGFLASCGLVVPRVDHVERVVRFATELGEIVGRFNAQNGARLTLRAGVDSGPLSSGLVGQKSMVYDLWGDAIDLAHRVHAVDRTPGVFVSQRVRDTLANTYTFTAVGTVETATGTEQVWALATGVIDV